MTALDMNFLDRPPSGWFVLDVMREGARKRNWVALMIDVPFDDFQNGAPSQSRFVRIPGKHRTRDEAWDALEDAGATRH